MAIEPYRAVEARDDRGFASQWAAYLALLVLWLVVTNLMFRALAGEMWVTGKALWNSGAGSSQASSFLFKLGTVAVLVIGSFLAYSNLEGFMKGLFGLVCSLDLLVLLMAGARAAGYDDIAVPIGAVTFTMPVATASLIIQSPLDVVLSGIASFLVDPFWSFLIILVRYLAWRRIVG